MFLLLTVIFIIFRTWSKFHSHPHRKRHATVVDDVKGRNVAIFLSENKKQRIEELCEL